MPDFILSATEGQGPSVLKVSPSEINKGSTDKTATVVIRSQTYGTEQRIKLTHKAPIIEYVFSVSPLSITFNRLGGSASINIENSYKTYNGTNREDLGYTVSSNLPEGIVYDDSTKSVTCEENEGLERSGTITLTQNESGKQLVINVAQRESSISTEFDVSPNPITFDTAGGSFTFTITSRQSVNEGGWEDVPYSVDTDGLPSGITYSNKVITATENQGNAKSGTITFTQDGTGASITVTVTQAAATLDFEFSVTPTEYNFGMDGGEKSFTVVSRKKVNGVWQNLEYTSAFTSSVPAGWKWNDEINTVTVPKNESTTSSPSFYIKFTQSETNDEIQVHITQTPYSEESYVIYGYDIGDLLPGMRKWMNSISVEWDDKGYNHDTVSNDAIGWFVVVRVKTVNGEPVVDVSSASKLMNYISDVGGIDKLGGDVSLALKNVDYKTSSNASWITVSLSEDINAALAGVPAVFPSFTQNSNTTKRTGTVTFEIPNNKAGTTTWKCEITQGGKPEEPVVPIGVHTEDGTDKVDIVTYSGSTGWQSDWINVTSFNAKGDPETPTVSISSVWQSFIKYQVEDRGGGKYRIRFRVDPTKVDEFRSNSGNTYNYIGNSYDSESVRVMFTIGSVDFTITQHIPNVIGWDSSKYLVVKLQSWESDPVYGAGEVLYTMLFAVRQNTGTFLALQSIGPGGKLGGNNHRKALGHRFVMMQAWKNCTLGGLNVDTFGEDVSSQISDSDGRKLSTHPQLTIPQNDESLPVVTLNLNLKYTP